MANNAQSANNAQDNKVTTPSKNETPAEMLARLKKQQADAKAEIDRMQAEIKKQRDAAKAEIAKLKAEEEKQKMLTFLDDSYNLVVNARAVPKNGDGSSKYLTLENAELIALVRAILKGEAVTVTYEPNKKTA